MIKKKVDQTEQLKQWIGKLIIRSYPCSLFGNEYMYFSHMQSGNLRLLDVKEDGPFDLFI